MQAKSGAALSRTTRPDSLGADRLIDLPDTGGDAVQEVERDRQRRRNLGWTINAMLRICMVYYLSEVLRYPHDHRFEGKALPVRNLLMVGSFTMLFPFRHLTFLRRGRYPIWLDNLYLSIFWLDMAGNSLDLYDRYLHFDLLPHSYGPGAAAVVLQEVLGLPALGAFGVANLLHILLEAQEYYTDVVFGTRNVRGRWDTAGDLLAGLVGTIAYTAIAEALKTVGKGNQCCSTR